MGQKIQDIYTLVQKKGGLKAGIRLAMLTKISILKAKDVEDSSENLQKFDAALKTIFGKTYQQLRLEP